MSIETSTQPLTPIYYIPMIGFLEGTVISATGSSLIVKVSGVGYKVFCPLPIIMGTSIENTISLFIHTHVREDNITLYGFSKEEELFVFEKLTSVSGIGPKSALAMLSVHSPASLATAVEEGDAETLSHTPGVGKKTSEKIIIELKGKLTHLIGESLSDNASEARMALEALGYSSKEIREALNGIKTDGKATGSIIKEALHQLQ